MLSDRVHNALARYVGLRIRSESEVRSYLRLRLKKYQLSEEDIEHLIGRYKELGFIDDEKYVEALTHSIVTNKAKGSRFLKIKLSLAGIPKEKIQQTITALDPADVTAAMHKRVAKYEKKLAELPSFQRKGKLYQILAAGGFSSAEIARFIDENS
ncbi:hypothetical protein C5B42_02155 [Candidatus Cerribacteria bacterium 'Amazon FNV 2010 28 9']|uniref:Regulatory protein RecX n=1 Tax=Candidatus Cerribacteria bacterium 'Amazon FNV 2010 28 9' TaxID=2081795 RepID=A0A317JPE3_9BACT|nr:MAG: hypothetical protein C5B42_02155 [Candidatus Cerribacteria bacterium 'Amazon FNV 2010 28 9']